MNTVKLNNGVEMPMLGYGVFLVSPEECERCVLDAIGVGYRLIDTAQAYYNEEGVGAAISKCGVPRNELFLTTKVWISNAGETNAARSIDESLRKLRTDYIDLLLIHQPFGDYYGTYRAMPRWQSTSNRVEQLLRCPLPRLGREYGNQACRAAIGNACVFPTTQNAQSYQRLRHAIDGLGAAGSRCRRHIYQRDIKSHR